MASITSYDHAAGKRWRVRYRKPDGRQTDKRGFRTKREAQAWLQENEVAKRRGEYVDPTAGKTTVDALAPAWLAAKKHRKPTTARRYGGIWRNQVQPAWGARTVGSITADEVQEWVDALDKSASTIRQAHGALAQLLDRAVRARMIPANPARDGIELPTGARRAPVFLTVDQLWALASASGQYRDVVLLLGYTGLRWSEMAGLKVCRWDARRRRLHIVETAGAMGWTSTKTGQERSVPVPTMVAELIDARCKGRGLQELIFPNAGGGPLANANARRDWFNPAVVAVFGAQKPAEGKRVRTDGAKPTVPVRPHDLRHTAASLAISAGANVKTVQTMLGHKSATMTLDLYGHMFDDDLSAVADALDKMRPAPRAV